ncbi:MAG: hypothetical protein ABJV04_10565 [Aliiglaciecola sp.]|uniref:hypothetical protein n=1 Tax=Aliiglaciecola sp. TaxID=1872441 RepID=UPI003298D334
MSVLKVACATLAVINLSGCITETVSSTSNISANKSATGSASQSQLNSIQQAEADAKVAVKQGNFKLLAFTNRVISFPGIDMDLYPVAVIEQQCGIKYLAGSGDTLKMGESTVSRKALKKYATTYNLIVLKGCQAFHKNNQK